MISRSLGTAVFIAVLAVGCKSADDDVEPIVKPKPVSFEGKVDPSYAGDWSDSGKSSHLELKPDGSATIELTTSSQAGRSTSHLKGKWLVQDGNLFMQYEDASKETTTLKYAAKLSGSKLVLQSGGHLSTTYLKK